MNIKDAVYFNFDNSENNASYNKITKCAYSNNKLDKFVIYDVNSTDIKYNEEYTFGIIVDEKFVKSVSSTNDKFFTKVMSVK